MGLLDSGEAVFATCAVVWIIIAAAAVAVVRQRVINERDRWQRIRPAFDQWLDAALQSRADYYTADRLEKSVRELLELSEPDQHAAGIHPPPRTASSLRRHR